MSEKQNDTTTVKMLFEVKKTYRDKVDEEVKLNKKLRKDLKSRTAVVNDALRVRYY